MLRWVAGWANISRLIAGASSSARSRRAGTSGEQFVSPPTSEQVGGGRDEDASAPRQLMGAETGSWLSIAAVDQEFSACIVTGVMNGYRWSHHLHGGAS
jgi:hypothetical protein